MYLEIPSCSRTLIFRYWQSLSPPEFGNEGALREDMITCSLIRLESIGNLKSRFELHTIRQDANSVHCAAKYLVYTKYTVQLQKQWCKMQSFLGMKFIVFKYYVFERQS